MLHRSSLKSIETKHIIRQEKLQELQKELLKMKMAILFYGVKAYGVPIGTKEYIAHWLELKSKKIISNLRKISDILDPNAIVPAEIPTRQCLWLLILTCLQFKGNYFLRHIHPPPPNSPSYYVIRSTPKSIT